MRAKNLQHDDVQVRLDIKIINKRKKCSPLRNVCFIDACHLEKLVSRNRAVMSSLTEGGWPECSCTRVRIHLFRFEGGHISLSLAIDSLSGS